MLWVHTFATLALVGLIWTIQLVHYPLMAAVKSGFRHYHEAHTTRITWLVGPLMGAELVTGLALTSEHADNPLLWTGLALVAVNWLATGLISVPLHSRLAREFDAQALARLVSTNWIRTVAWTLRGVLVLALVAQGTAG